jgi:hypothetical protein
MPYFIAKFDTHMASLSLDMARRMVHAEAKHPSHSDDQARTTRELLGFMHA